MARVVGVEPDPDVNGIHRDINVALDRSERMEAVTLEQFVGSALDMPLEELAAMPGSPALVMVSQCMHYIRSSTELLECERRNMESFRVLTSAMHQCPPVRLGFGEDNPEGRDLE